MQYLLQLKLMLEIFRLEKLPSSLNFISCFYFKFEVLQNTNTLIPKDTLCSLPHLVNSQDKETALHPNNR